MEEETSREIPPYVWEISLKQAPISATYSLITLVFIVLIGFALLGEWKYVTNRWKYYEDDDVWKTVVDQYGDGFLILLGVLTVVWFGTFCLLLPELVSNVVTGYFNPEYWAYSQFLK